MLYVVMQRSRHVICMFLQRSPCSKSNAYHAEIQFLDVWWCVSHMKGSMSCNGSERDSRQITDINADVLQQWLVWFHGLCLVTLMRTSLQIHDLQEILTAASNWQVHTPMWCNCIDTTNTAAQEARLCSPPVSTERVPESTPALSAFHASATVTKLVPGFTEDDT